MTFQDEKVRMKEMGRKRGAVGFSNEYLRNQLMVGLVYALITEIIDPNSVLTPQGMCGSERGCVCVCVKKGHLK